MNAEDVGASAQLARDFMAPVNPALRPETSLQEAPKILEASPDRDAFVIDEFGRPRLGSISTLYILDHIHSRELPGRFHDGAPPERIPIEASVISAMRPGAVTASPETPVDLIRTYMRHARIRKILICEGSRIVGQVSAARVGEEG